MSLTNACFQSDHLKMREQCACEGGEAIELGTARWRWFVLVFSDSLLLDTGTTARQRSVHKGDVTAGLRLSHHSIQVIVLCRMRTQLSSDDTKTWRLWVRVEVLGVVLW